MVSKQLIGRAGTFLIGLGLILAVGCGTAEAPDPTSIPEADGPTAAPTMDETSPPTAVPEATDGPADVEVNPGKLNVMAGDLGTERFDFSFAAGPEPRNYGRIIGGFLISTNENTEMVPGIAEEWGLSDDGLTWTFTIREAVKFHDGSDVTPEDVLWTLQHTWGPRAFEYTTVSTVMTVSRIVDTIELTGPATVSLTMTQPFTTFDVGISEAGSGWYHIMPKRTTVGDTEEAIAYDNDPIGAGIMKLVDHVPASAMRFERFDDYYYQPENGFPEDKRVNFQSLDMLVVPEESTRVAALRAGDVDIAPASLTTKDQVEAGGGRLIFGQEGALTQGKLFGCYEQQYPCSDKRVRQALDYALDKELIRDQLYGGSEVFQVKGWAVVTPSTIGYSSDLVPFPYDPDKARQLLADAGYPGGEGFGKLIINTYSSRTAPFLVESAQIGADMWKRELGLDVEVRVQDDAALKEAVSLTEDHFGQVLWRDQDARVDAAALLRSNYGTYYPPETDQKKDRAHEDPELRAFIQEAIGVFDPIEREKALNNAYQRVRDEAYWVSVGYLNVPWGVGPRIQTWEPYPLATYPSALHTVTLE